MMRFENYIAKRYIFTGRRFQFITLISRLSIIGITIGVSALVIVMSIFNGFRQMQREQLMGIDAHLQLYTEDEGIYEELERRDKIAVLSYEKSKKVMIGHGQSNAGAILISYSNPQFIKKFIPTSREGIVIGGVLAQRLKVFEGDSIKIITPRQIKESIASYRKPRAEERIVSGKFYTNMKNYDEYYIFESKRREMGEKSRWNSIVCRIKEPEEASRIKESLMQEHPGIEIETWQDKNSQLLGIMEFERYATFIILSLIILIAAFNLLVSITMTALEKEQDIAILRVLGGTRERIRGIFFRVGFYTGTMGTLTGLVMGLIAIYAQQRWGWIPVASTNNIIMPDIPVQANANEILSAVVLSLGLTAISSSLPGRYILKRNLIASLRGDN